MKVSIIFYPEERDYTEQLLDKTVIVIDVFRSTTCMITALAYGANGIIPVRTVEEARMYKGKDNLLIAGEENSLKPADFDLGNSPKEFRTPMIKGKWIVMRTSNGTQAIVLAAQAKHLLIGAFVNATSCARLAEKLQNDTVIFCSGTRGNFSLEDSITAGCIASILNKRGDVILDDSALILAESYQFLEKSSFSLLWRSRTAKRLKKIGRLLDINDCLQMDRYGVIPHYHNGVIVPYS